MKYGYELDYTQLFDKHKISLYHEIAFQYEKWRQEIPYLNFKKEWDVKIIPPLNGAIIRFNVKCKEKFISVYLDGYDLLGWRGQPYWEIYCEQYGDPERFILADYETMMKRIEEILEN